MVLAVLSLIGGYVGIPHIFGGTNHFEEWLHPVMSGPSHEVAKHALASTGHSALEEWSLMLMSVALVAFAIYMAHYFYRKNTAVASSLAGKLSGIKTLLANKYYVDEFYGAVVVRPTVYFSLFLWKIFDVIIIDGSLNGTARLWRDVSDGLRYSQSGQLRGYATIFAAGVVLLIAYFVAG
jgi:NADH-quinone oxidoreductase subunit L